MQLWAKDTYGKEITTSYYLYIIANEDDESMIDSNEANRIIYLPFNISETYSLNQAIIDNELSSKDRLITDSNSKRTGTVQKEDTYDIKNNTGKEQSIKILEY